MLVVSQAWPVSQKTGVPLAAAMHVRMLLEAGCCVSIVGSDAAVLQEDLPVAGRFHVRARGSGAMYAPSRVDRTALLGVIEDCRPDLVMVEAWQTALTDAAVDMAYSLGLPVMVVSHGVSVHPFTRSWTDRLRAWAWWPYRALALPSRVHKLSLLTMLDENAQSYRFYDRNLARKAGVPLRNLVNAPVNLAPGFRPRVDRQRKVLCVGYFSRIKNQLAAIDLVQHLPGDIKLHCIGNKTGAYYLACVERVKTLGLQDRVIFSDDTECHVAEEIARSMVLLSTSITEVLPLVLLEAMASGTPFVATPVGAVSELGCGALAAEPAEMAVCLRRLLDDDCHWAQQAREGLDSYGRKYSLERVRQQLIEAVNAVLSGRGLADPVS